MIYSDQHSLYFDIELDHENDALKHLPASLVLDHLDHRGSPALRLLLDHSLLDDPIQTLFD